MKYEVITCHYFILTLVTVFLPITAIKVSKSITLNQTPQQANSALSESHGVDYQSLDDGDKAMPLSWNPSIGTMQDEKRELKQLEQFNAEIEASLKRGDSVSINDDDDPRFQKRVSDEIHSKVSAIKDEIKRDTALVNKNDRNKHPTADIMVEGDIDVDEKDEKIDKSKLKHHSKAHAAGDTGKEKGACNKLHKDKDEKSDDQQESDEPVDQKEGPDDDLFKDPQKGNQDSNKQSDDYRDTAECNRNGPRPKGPPGKKGAQKHNTDKNEQDPKTKSDSVDEAIRHELDMEVSENEPMDSPNQASLNTPTDTDGHWKTRSDDISSENRYDQLMGNIGENQKSSEDENHLVGNEEEDNSDEQEGGAHEKQPVNGNEDVDLGLLDIVQTIHALRKRDAVYDRLFGGTRREKRSSNDQRNRRRENYIRALEESFPNPNVGADTEQDSLEPHVRVKRRNPLHGSKIRKTKFV